MPKEAFNFYHELGEEPPPLTPKRQSESFQTMRPIMLPDVNAVLDAYEELRCAVYNYIMGVPSASRRTLVEAHDKVVVAQARVQGRQVPPPDPPF